MRKHLIAQPAPPFLPDGQRWLALESIVQAALTSEDPSHPMEAAFQSGTTSGWRASAPGRQTIRLFFDQPRRIRRVHLVFVEDNAPRTQEFLLRWSSDNGLSYREIVRQQYTFSPPQTVLETEDYAVDLPDLNVFEISVLPDIGGGDARASLAELRLA